MSACDTCPKPGNCCRAIQLASGGFPSKRAKTIEEAQAEIDSYNGDGRLAGRQIPIGHNPLPFKPLFRHVSGRWVLWCPNLDRQSGRCLDYDKRPFACSDYKPGTDDLCVRWAGPRTQEPVWKNEGATECPSARPISSSP